MLFIATSMDNAEQVSLPSVPEAIVETADVLLVLDDGIVIPCHGHILSMHSAVICNMLEDLTSQLNEKIQIPLADFTAEQCLVLLEYLSNKDASCQGPALRHMPRQTSMQQSLWRALRTLMTRRMPCGTLRPT